MTHVHNRARERICRRGQTRVCEPDELSAFLDESCAGDEVLRGKVEELLAAHRQSGSFIETPRATLTTSILEDGETDLLIGQTIGHYRILNRISAGGMGTVYLVERRENGFTQRAALKLVRGCAFDRRLAERFSEERRILGTALRILSREVALARGREPDQVREEIERIVYR